jgi:nucleotide-binding universal stress UspA family protein
MTKLQILVPLQTYPEGNAPAMAGYAAAVGRHLGADLHALMHAVEFPQVSSPLGDRLVDVPTMVAKAKASSRTRGNALLEALQSESKRLGVPARTTEAACFPASFADAVAAHARYHDLVVVGLGVDRPDLHEVAEAAIFQSGKPVLVVPELAKSAKFERVMVAWDGSRVAARAVTDARDFLDRAQSVVIVSVVDEKPISHEHSADRLADYLARRGLRAAAEQIPVGDRPIARALEDHAQATGADMVVMGAFGHSRFREFLLGGATRGILNDPRRPVLLSH